MQTYTIFIVLVVMVTCHSSSKGIFDHQDIMQGHLLPYLDAPTKLKCLLLNRALYHFFKQVLKNDYDNLYHTVYDKMNEKMKEKYPEKDLGFEITKEEEDKKYKIVSKYKKTKIEFKFKFDRNYFAHPFSLKVENRICAENHMHGTTFNFDPKNNAFNTERFFKLSSLSSTPTFNANVVHLCLNTKSPIFIHFQKGNISTKTLVTVQQENQNSVIRKVKAIFFWILLFFCLLGYVGKTASTYILFPLLLLDKIVDLLLFIR